MRQIINLNGTTWQVGPVTQKPFGDVNDLDGVQEWIPAQVPGDVRLDLLRMGRIPDPFYGTNNDESQWVDAKDWWYKKSVELQSELEEGEGGRQRRAFLIFEGIDYQSAVFVNGRQLGRHTGMFSRQVYEMPTGERRRTTEVDSQSSVLGSRSSVVEIAVRVWGADALPKMHLTPVQKIWGALLAPLQTPNRAFPDRYATVKSQMQFGWDFAPRLRTCGIWDDAYLVLCRSVFIENAWVKAEVAARGAPVADVQAVLSLDADHAQDVRLVLTAKGKNVEVDPQSFTFDLRLDAGKQTHILRFRLNQPLPWNPWDRGNPNLYELTIFIVPPTHPERSPKGAVEGSPKFPKGPPVSPPHTLDNLTITFGIRSFTLAPPSGAGRNAEPWAFVINGEREFLRGANWVPLDAIPGRLTREHYAARLDQVREANINFLRVWGGGLREKRAFYDLCDDLGILVWQEFPFAGAILDRFPNDPAFLRLVRDEARGITRSLRNHPSLVVWCGGNEFNTRGNRKIVETLREVVAAEDGTRPFKPASPYRDESHNWRVWHRSANLADYKKDPAPFMSEFGLQAAPDVESLRRFLTEDRLFPPNALWTYHHAELKKLERYARTVDPGVNSLESFVQATQRAQAYGLQIGIEHMRRRKGAAAGVAIWQFDDAWPAISWSVVDYYGKPKRAYQELVRLYSPILASFDYEVKPRRAGDTVHGSLWLINDWRRSFENVELSVFLNGGPIQARRVRLAPDSSERIGSLDVTLGKGENILRLVLRDGERELSDHAYDLNFGDQGRINPLIAMLYPIYMRLMR